MAGIWVFHEGRQSQESLGQLFPWGDRPVLLMGGDHGAGAGLQHRVLQHPALVTQGPPLGATGTDPSSGHGMGPHSPAPGGYGVDGICL